MLSSERHQHHRSLLFNSGKRTDMHKATTSGTLSPDITTTTTTSSGYSTGGSFVSTSTKPSVKKSSSIASKQQPQQYKTKSKGIQNIFAKLKNFLVPSSKPCKLMRSTVSREISSTNRLRQYRQQSPIYDVFPSSSLSSTTVNPNPISIPFTYHQNSPIRQSQATYEKISAWLNHTETLIKPKPSSEDSLFIDMNNEQTHSSLSSIDINHQGMNIAMKKVSTSIKPPKRSSSLVSRITRPIIEQQVQKTISPSSSFSSSILMRGMSERVTPPPPPLPQKNDSQLNKSNRQRTIDFSRRRTVAGINEYHPNKENISMKTPSKPSANIYQFPISPSNNRVEIHIPPNKNMSAKKYYFHSDSIKPTEDLLNNSYGLTLLTQQARHSNTSVLLVSQIPNHLSTHKPMPTPRTSIPQTTTLDSLDDLLCDREVESYFYPISSPLEHIYTNLEQPSLTSSASYFHGTLC